MADPTSDMTTCSSSCTDGSPSSSSSRMSSTGGSSTCSSSPAASSSSFYSFSYPSSSSSFSSSSLSSSSSSLSSSSSISDLIELSVRCVDGRTTSLTIPGDLHVRDLKELLSEQLGITVGGQRLLWRGRISWPINGDRTRRVRHPRLVVVHHLRGGLPRRLLHLGILLLLPPHHRRRGESFDLLLRHHLKLRRLQLPRTHLQLPLLSLEPLPLLLRRLVRRKTVMRQRHPIRLHLHSLHAEFEPHTFKADFL